MSAGKGDDCAKCGKPVVSRMLGCAGLSAVALFYLAAMLLALSTALDCWLFHADPSDIRFNPMLYIGRRCRGVEIKAEPWGDPSVTVTNGRDEPIRDLKVTAKYFGYRGRLVTEWEHRSLASGGSVTFDPPVDVFELDLGMIYVLLKCDRGVAVEQAWYSYWY